MCPITIDGINHQATVTRFSGKCGLPAKPFPAARPTLNCVHEDSLQSPQGHRDFSRVDWGVPQ